MLINLADFASHIYFLGRDLVTKYTRQ